MHRYFLRSAVALVLSAQFACAMGNTGPHVRVATATKAELEAAQEADTVWYEFQPGDIVPFQFLLIGLAVSAGEPQPMKALDHFWIVLSKHAPIAVSLDGENIAPHQTELVTAITVNDDGKAQVNWVNYVGQGSADEELSRMAGSAEE